MLRNPVFQSVSRVKILVSKNYCFLTRSKRFPATWPDYFQISNKMLIWYLLEKIKVEKAVNMRKITDGSDKIINYRPRLA